MIAASAHRVTRGSLWQRVQLLGPGSLSSTPTEDQDGSFQQTDRGGRYILQSTFILLARKDVRICYAGRRVNRVSCGRN